MRALQPLAMTLLMMATLPTAAGHAQQEPNCKDWANLPQQSMNQCAGIAYQDADAGLNAVWGQLRERRGNGHSWDPILEAQRAWITFRDAHCESVAAPMRAVPSSRSSALDAWKTSRFSAPRNWKIFS